MSTEYNPYNPPKADLDGAGREQSERPRSVDIAVALIGVNILLAVIRIPGAWQGMQTGEVSPLFVGVQVLGVALWVWVCFALLRGRNWARILLLVLTALSLAGIGAMFAGSRLAAGSLFQYLGAEQLIMPLLPLLLNIAAVYLVFVPGRAWFRRVAVLR